MASPRYPTTIWNLPGEVLSEIFVRLLSKQLAQMRSVCKPWNALLTDSSFIKSHLNHSIQNNDDILLFFGKVFSFDCGPFTARTSRSPDIKLTNLIKLPLNLPSKFQCGFVVGSVNGLICFTYGSSQNGFLVHIWNPSLSAMLILPPSSLPSTEILSMLGFGYVPKTDDYKVVKLTTTTQAEVYSLRKGSWKSISQRLPCHVTRLTWQNQVCVDGRLHWLGSARMKWETKMVMGFDLGAKTFHEIPLSDSLLHNHASRIYRLGVLGGKLCVMSRVINGKWEMWVMDEYGVPESWVKHHVFSQFSADIFPYGFTSHDQFLYQVVGDIDHCSLYDPIAAKTKIFKITVGPSHLIKVIEYVDSLVWIAPANRI